MRLVSRVGLYVLPLLAANVLCAKDGDLDLTFNATGKVTAIFSPSSPFNNDLAFSVLVQPDNKVVVGGWVSDISDPADFAVARFNPNGTLDYGFGGTGLVRPGGFGLFSPEEAFTMLRQPDGKLVLGGWAATSVVPGTADFSLLRLLPNGTLDGTFDGGKVRVDLGGDDWVLALARQTDGKILAGGRTGALGHHAFALARFLANGKLDLTFGDPSTPGHLRTDFVGRDSTIDALVVQADGHILAVGTSELAVTGGTRRIVMARYTAAGRPDLTFGVAGKTLIQVGAECAATAVSLLPAGKFLVGGGVAVTGGVNTADFALIRFTAAGKVDLTFGPRTTPGHVTTDFAHKFDGVGGMRVLANGKIVVAGEVNATTIGTGDGAFGLARYTAAGILDTTFGVNGRVITPVGGRGSRGESLAVAPGGKLVVAGPVFSTNLQYGASFGVARYLGTVPAVAEPRVLSMADGNSADDPSEDASDDPDVPDQNPQ